MTPAEYPTRACRREGEPHRVMPMGFLGKGYHERGCHSEQCGDNGCDCTLMQRFEAALPPYDPRQAVRTCCGDTHWGPEPIDYPCPDSDPSQEQPCDVTTPATVGNAQPGGAS